MTKDEFVSLFESRMSKENKIQLPCSLLLLRRSIKESAITKDNHESIKVAFSIKLCMLLVPIENFLCALRIFDDIISECILRKDFEESKVLDSKNRIKP